ncbi:MAG: DEAD/DEAH box helicase, partial [Actinomycetota bacterium]
MDPAAKAPVSRSRASKVAEPPAPDDPAAAFEQNYGFPFDEFQRRACNALVDGSSVLVAAPTGAGKTVVGEFAAWLALRTGGRAFYTTPIKALSNQKYGDFSKTHGADNVGLLTGDNSINGDAPIVVMTTEVLRNMIYEDSIALEQLRYVVLDEVHYLQNRYRGAVWEEILIHLPVDIQTVSLSATVSNAEEFAEWLQTLRGRTEVIIEERRPVELRHWYFASDQLLPMFVQRPDGEVLPNPRARDVDRRRQPNRPARGGRRYPRRNPRAPLRSDVIDRLDADRMLPAIYFIFSRRGCDDAVQQCLRENLHLTTSAERAEIAALVDEKIADLSAADLAVLGYDGWLSGLLAGISAHHAGMIPPFKEAVEELFVRSLVKVVFATETLSLGINMPARSVVLESLTKFTGEKHELMTAGEFTQLSGRAGRRGIDELGHCVVLYQRFTPFDVITRLASTRTYPLQSSFQPSYNMAVNLVRTYDREEAQHLVNSSFGQFQADRDVVKLEQTRERSEAYLATYHERMTCEKGDVLEYRELVDRLRKIESRGSPRGRSGRSQVADAIAGLARGDVIEIPTGKRRGIYAIVDAASGGAERRPRLLALSTQRSMVRLGPADFPEPPRRLTRIDVPRRFDSRDPSARRDVARALKAINLDAFEVEEPGSAEERDELRALRRAIARHPVDTCPERGRHFHFADRAARLERELKNLDRRISHRTATLSRRFDRVLEVLQELGYVDGWSLTPTGELLTRIYNEADLLVAEAVERGLLQELDPAGIAAVASTLVYEARGPEPSVYTPMPTAATRKTLGRLMKLWQEIHNAEEQRGIDLTRVPDSGYAGRIHAWASDMPLDDVLQDDDAPGDFVRVCKQLIDLLRQLSG